VGPDLGMVRVMELSIVVPCFNEEAVLPETVRRLVETLGALQSKGKISHESRIYFVDDGSRDRTWALIEDFSRQHQAVCGIKLSRNFGQQQATLAGLLNVGGDALISVDADLQDDLGAIEKMLDACRDGHDVVYGVRNKRETDSFFKRWSALCFYRLMAWLTGKEKIIYNHADYRLLSRLALEHLRDFKEINLFLRGIVPLLGFPSTCVYYDRASRYAGHSAYNMRQLFRLAIDGLTSFSVFPLRLITTLGLLISLLSSAFCMWALLAVFSDTAVPGWASTVVPLSLLSGVQLLSIGVVGEYLAKVYMETKARPRYIIEKRV